MVKLEDLDEGEMLELFQELFFHGRHPAFAGSKVLSEGGHGQIDFPQAEGPMFQGQRIALLGAPYRVVGLNRGGACCPHFALGKIVTGAEDIQWRGTPIVMTGDRGVHAHACGTNTVIVTEGWRKIQTPGETFDFYPM
ncbi:hypothetical protein IV417_18525 [Alphaproteobacteria bacterium KMM 3653]|uniref:Uncharacterized protein n=1 Tax=Harenicola maris TaxID=2841044 RepID=A0AAP2CVP1_9RHOB|nr:hypothetical protein [Harenicola maris]